MSKLDDLIRDALDAKDQEIFDKTEDHYDRASSAFLDWHLVCY